MSFLQITIFISAAFILGAILKGYWRGWILFIGSLLAVFWLQPFSPVRHLDFWLPFATLALTGVTWVITRPEDYSFTRETWLTVGVTAGIIVIVGLLRYLEPLCCLTASSPPGMLDIFIALLIIGSTGWIAARFHKTRRLWLIAWMVGIILVFVILKTEVLGSQLSAALRALNGQSTNLAAAIDIRWLGFSYIAFRLLHVLRDRQTGKASDLSLREFVTYIIFFPALSAGPIDRSQRFAQDLRKDFKFSESGILDAGTRILIGIFKKFALADSLALIALNEANASQVTSSGWTWILVYAYTLRIFFDFSGYTDIAIGIGLLFGIRLPENFDQPYLKSNLTAFWNSWHITLALWFRAYFFNPFTRMLRTGKISLPLPAIIFAGQFATMLLIGLWHGITWNFVIWGAWHGVGLFIHNRWTEANRSKIATVEPGIWRRRWRNGLGILVTFHFVSLGWVWFALSTPQTSWQVFMKLFGLGG